MGEDEEKKIMKESTYMQGKSEVLEGEEGHLEGKEA